MVGRFLRKLLKKGEKRICSWCFLHPVRLISWGGVARKKQQLCQPLFSPLTFHQSRLYLFPRQWFYVIGKGAKQGHCYTLVRPPPSRVCNNPFFCLWTFPLENIKDKNISGVTSDNIHSRDTSDILVVIQNDCYGTVSKGWLKSKELQCECVDLHIETSTDRANKCNLTETKQKDPWASWIISL